MRPQEQQSEEWRVIDNYEMYEVSNNGRVRNRSGLILKPSYASGGYARVVLVDNGIGYSCMVSHLVAAAFIRPAQMGEVVHHKDNTRRNDAASNLEYLKLCEHTKHHFALSTRRHPCAKFTDEEVLKMRRLKEKGVSYSALRAKYHASTCTLHKLINGATYKHLKGEH